MFQGVIVPNPPDSGKEIAKGKGVPGNRESEGSRRQITGFIVILRAQEYPGCVLQPGMFIQVISCR